MYLLGVHLIVSNLKLFTKTGHTVLKPIDISISGCSGLIVPGSQVFVTPKSSAAAKSKYSLDLIDLGYTVVGANPNFCNKMVRFALEKGWIEGLPKFDSKVHNIYTFNSPVKRIELDQKKLSMVT